MARLFLFNKDGKLFMYMVEREISLNQVEIRWLNSLVKRKAKEIIEKEPERVLF